MTPPTRAPLDDLPDGCPFCGEKPEITKHYKMDAWGLIHSCKIIGPVSWDFTENKSRMIALWNTRSTPTAKPGDESSIVNFAIDVLEDCSNTIIDFGRIQEALAKMRLLPQPPKQETEG